MNLNVREYNNKQLLLFPPSIGDYLAKDDLAHIVDEAVDMIDLRPYYDKISGVGNPTYHPALMIKIWFYGYATKVYSSRRIEDRLHKDVAFIYLAGMQKPDFKTIAEFRRKYLLELKGSFTDILQICHRLGLTRLGDISIDSKVIKANASLDRTYDEERLTKERQHIQDAIERYLEEAEQADLKEDEKFGVNSDGNELPEGVNDKAQRVKRMKQISEQLRQTQEKLKVSNRKKINFTDNDARFQKSSGGRIIPGYRGQIAVDSKNQIIIANDVSHRENDCSELIPMVDKTLESIEGLNTKEGVDNNDTGQDCINVIADGGYSSGKNLAELENEKYKEKVEPYIPDTNSESKERGKGYDKESPFHRSKFTYNEKENDFTCPVGQKLRYVGKCNHHGVLYDVYGDSRECKSCQHFGKCTTNVKGRRIVISEHQPLIDKMRQKLSTEEGKRRYRLRKITVEPVFGNLSYNLGFREFLLRGLGKVKGEFSLMCIAHNLLKIAKVVKQSGLTLRDSLTQAELFIITKVSRSEPELSVIFDTS